MIDEKKLIETFEDMALSWGEMHDKESKYRRFNMEEIERVVDNQPKICEWIPCSERLPEEDKDVLIYTPYDGVDIAYISDENWRYSRGDDFIETVEKANVLAWQPLPEAYHGQMD